MKPNDGRCRVIIEEIEPQIDGGRYPAKRVVGDTVTVTAAIFGDGHDHIAARLLYKAPAERKWQSTPFVALPNDTWSAAFDVDQMGLWSFAVDAWVDHLDTWIHDLDKRLGAQTGSTQDIPLALRIGAKHFAETASRAKGTDAKKLRLIAQQITALAESNLPFYDSPITPEMAELAAKYPDTRFATKTATALPLWVDRTRAQFSAWYELFPRSFGQNGEHGTFQDVQAQLPRIASMGFDILYMPPIHPIGLQFRKGRNNSVTAQPGEEGSPWAVGGAEGGHLAVHPKLGTLADFDDLVNACGMHGLEVALDIAFQCAPDHPWVKEHPDWFIVRPDGSIQYAENPPKKYQDIYPLNFESADWRALWDALLGVFAFWVEHGVKVFRVDNPHTKALPFWEWCITEVHRTHPEVLFLAEAFTRPHVMYSLAKAGYSQGYTYFTWRTTKDDLESYFKEITKPPVSWFYRPNVWPNTPDILHAQLQEPDPAARLAIYRQRVILAATLASNYGIYGPAYELQEWRPVKPVPPKVASEEYLDSEKYELRQWDLDDPGSLQPLLTTLNGIRRGNAALQSNESLVFHAVDNENILLYSKRAGDNVVMVAVNLDPLATQAGWTDLNMAELGLKWDDGFALEDMLTVAPLYKWQRQWNFLQLTPGQTAHIFRVIPDPILPDPAIAAAAGPGKPNGI
jgi:starch synthase (maltosyl-transferring)